MSTIIRANNVCVGLSKETQLPAGLVLPAGLHLRPGSVKLEEASADAASSHTLSLVTLQYIAAVCFKSTDVQSLVSSIKLADMISVNGAPLVHETLAEILPNLSDQIAVAVQLYSSGWKRANTEGPVYKSVSSDAKYVTRNLDCLAYCSPTTTRQQILGLIASYVKAVLTESLSVAENGQVSTTHHRVLGADLAATFISPLHEDEQSAESVARRRSISDALLLPADRPLLQRSCNALGAAMSFTDGGWPGRLANLHQGIKSHGLRSEGVSVHIMQGKYLYCHYLQDKFNDAKWGCAYKPLHTILSWCALEQYVQFEHGKIPTHKQIQQALVDVGDQKSKFVDSKEWIGANEVCFALETLTRVRSKILNVSHGAEMESKGREFAEHFDTEGSPVMVGIGVLAWTIMGVARDSPTGETKFLILDPHYEGRDDLAVIHKKGWVAWKGRDVSVQNAFYKLCMTLARHAPRWNAKRTWRRTACDDAQTVASARRRSRRGSGEEAPAVGRSWDELEEAASIPESFQRMSMRWVETWLVFVFAGDGVPIVQGAMERACLKGVCGECDIVGEFGSRSKPECLQVAFIDSSGVGSDSSRLIDTT